MSFFLSLFLPNCIVGLGVFLRQRQRGRRGLPCGSEVGFHRRRERSASVLPPAAEGGRPAAQGGFLRQSAQKGGSSQRCPEAW